MNMAEKKTTKKGKAKVTAKTAPARKAVKKAAPAAPKKPATEQTKTMKAEKEVRPAEEKPKEVKRLGKGRGPRKLGLGIPLPTGEPEEYDAHCPFFGRTTVRGRSLIGIVISAKMHRTVKVEIGRKHYVRKYERYEKRRTKLLVHNPPSVNAKVGDTVRIMETRPISKTKHFVVVERIQAKEPAVTATEEKKG